MEEQLNLKDIYPDDINISSFNCAGFAFGILDWYTLDDKVDFPEGEDYREDLEVELLNEYTNIILQELGSFVRAVDKIEDIKDDEYATYLRCDPETLDFHFVRDYNNTLLEKNGYKEITHVPGGIDIINGNWDWSDMLNEHMLCNSMTQILAVKEYKDWSDRNKGYYINSNLYISYKTDQILDNFKSIELDLDTQILEAFQSEEQALEHSYGQGDNTYLLNFRKPYGFVKDSKFNLLIDKDINIYREMLMMGFFMHTKK